MRFNRRHLLIAAMAVVLLALILSTVVFAHGRTLYADEDRIVTTRHQIAVTGRILRYTARAGRLPILSLGWLHINWNRTSASAIKAYRPGFLERREAFRLLREGKITADEARKLIEPKVEQIGDPQLELAAGQSADQRDALIAGMWNVKDRDGVIRKSLADRLTQRASGIAGGVQSALDQIPMPQPKQISSESAVHRLESSSAEGGE